MTSTTPAPSPSPTAPTADHGSRVTLPLLSIALLAILVVAPTQHSFEIAKKTYLSLVDPLVCLTGLAWAVAVLRREKLRAIGRIPVLPAAFVTIVALSIARTISVASSLKDIVQLVEYFVVALMLFCAGTDDERDRARLVYAFLGVAAIITLLACGQYMRTDLDAMDVRGTFGNRNVFGGYLSLVLPIAFAMVLRHPRLPIRIACAVLVLLGLCVGLSGATLIAVCVALLLVAALRGTGAVITTAVCVGVIVAILLPHLPRDNPRILEESVQLYDANDEVTRRYTEWQAAAFMAAENPLLGVGIGTYQQNIGGYYGTLPSPAGKSEADSQNMYLVLASSAGILALALFLGMLGSYAVKAGRGALRAASAFDQALAAGCVGSLVAFAINCVWSPLLVRGIGVPLAVVLAFCYAVDRAACVTADQRPD